tara:strand:+ start:1014 stop:1235 length:222 start_codon:yes stop_codon:yes gene_type:complete
MEIDKIWNMIEEGFGGVHESTSEEEKHHYVVKSIEGLHIGLRNFKTNCSASNFNGMVLALLSYQYWTQKKVKE